MSWFNAIVHGIFLGGFYALLATGLSLMFGVMRIINLAHGTLALLGAYAAYLLVEHWNISPYLTLLPVLPAAFLFGYVLQRTMLDRSLRSGPLEGPNDDRIAKKIPASAAVATAIAVARA